MSNFTIYNTAGQGMDMRFASFGLSYVNQTGYVAKDTWNANTGEGHATIAIQNNISIDTWYADYRWGGPGFSQINFDALNGYKAGVLTFSATNLNLVGAANQGLTDPLSAVTYDVLMSENDTIIGNDFSDQIWAGNGNDAIYGNGGDDHISGAAGNNYINGG